MQTVSGDVRLGTVTGPVSATLVSGDFAIDDAHTDLSAKTVSGDQRIGAIREGQIKLQSVSGDVRLGVRPGTRLRIDASSTSGDVSSELDVKDEPVQRCRAAPRRGCRPRPSAATSRSPGPPPSR